jgi:hypothetical protein
MRYPKGSVGLNHKKDKAILHFVADSRFVTRSQLNSFALLEYCELNRRVFNWRIQRLVEAGLMRKQIVPYLNGEALFSITRTGVQALERLGIYYLGANLEREKDALEFQIPHSLELNSIRIALKATTNLLLWIPEVAIRVLNLSPATAYAKVYDGIAELYVDGGNVTLAIEYERTFKSKAKYDKIWEAIESEKRLNAFLYLVPNTTLLWGLVREFKGTKRPVYFGLVDEFKEKVFDADVWSASYDRSTLRSALLQAARASKGQS